uniref:HD/PDEase domain-containing protein n=1 Tax=Mucochytrium quahogii TaxID=96639 RepID=A0A7S2S2L2_9STRA|mmetsp:Transcript_44243/g.70716  ORF Transcript_44243/g.70716 Transcript_44243/m.70716 type:complete len:610 (+) Transcript_44243:283-2112(+)
MKRMTNKSSKRQSAAGQTKLMDHYRVKAKSARLNDMKTAGKVVSMVIEEESVPSGDKAVYKPAKRSFISLVVDDVAQAEEKMKNCTTNQALSINPRPRRGGRKRCESFVTCDIIHGRIELPPLAKRIIDTKYFQRLANLKQLGFSALKWRNANHTRFEHSVGVAHLAGEWVRHLQMNQPELGISASDILCVQIAGLVHDLGHGPYSHVFDSKVVPRLRDVKVPWSHEDGSVLLLDALIQDYDINLDEYGLDPVEDVKIIKDMILGVDKKERERRDRLNCWPRKRFLYDIVANDESGLDVDKLDYLQRDSSRIAVPGLSNCNFKCLLEQSRVRKCFEDGRVVERVCFPRDLFRVLATAFRTRFELHQDVYQHTDVKGWEYMMADFLLEVNEDFRFRGAKISETIHDPRKYVRLTDNVLDTIGGWLEENNDPKFDKARDLYCRFTERRDGYKEAGSVVLVDSLEQVFVKLGKKRFQENVHRAICFGGVYPGDEDELGENDKPLLPMDSFHVDVHLVHWGQKAKNPLESVWFFKDPESMDFAKPGAICLKEKYKSYLPTKFMLVKVSVFVKNQEDKDDTHKYFQKWAETEGEMEVTYTQDETISQISPHTHM